LVKGLRDEEREEDVSVVTGGRFAATKTTKGREQDSIWIHGAKHSG
jgi:hypothetical protein